MGWGGPEEGQGGAQALVVAHLHAVAAEGGAAEAEIGGRRVRAVLTPPDPLQRCVGLWVVEPGEPPPAPLAAVVRVSYLLGGQPASFLTTVVGRVDPSRWLLALPRGVAGAERRSAPRVSLGPNDGFTLRLDLDEGEPLRTPPLDLSSGGLSFRAPADRVPAVGAAIPTRLLIEGGGSIALLAGVVSLRPGATAEEPWRVGCHLLGAAVADQAALARVVVALGGVALAGGAAGQ